MAATATGNSTVNGGLIAANSNVTISGFMVAKVGDLIADHPAAPFGIGVHTGATVAVGSLVENIRGFPMARTGDLCSCGHTIDPPGMVNIQSGT